MLNKQPQSPCISVCKLESDPSGVEICKGCLRTLDEIVRWSRMTADEKQQVLDRIKLASKTPLS